MWQLQLQNSNQKSIWKVPLLGILQGINFECYQYKRAFTEKGNLKTHISFVHYVIQFSPWCNKCPFKLKTRGDLQKHIIWIHEGKEPPCGLCDYWPTHNSSMAKHIELIHGQLASFSICIECGHTSATKAGLDKHIKCEVRSFQLWTLLKDVYPESCASAAHENSYGWKAKRVSVLWESIHNRLSPQKTCSTSSQCDYKEPVQGKNRLVK